MPNLCMYTMKVVGKREDLMEFHSRMRDYDKPNHLFRVFDASIYDEGIDRGNYYMCVSGDCAWSIESCCRASGYSNGIDLFAVNTKELKLKLECWSEEGGMCFQEHYIYDNGECMCDECTEWISYYYDRDEYASFEEFKEDQGLPEYYTENDLDDGDFCYTGGFEDYCTFSI